MRRLLGFALILVPVLCWGQPDTLWTRTFGGSGDQYAYSMQQTTDGGFVIAGATYPPGGGGTSYFYVVKTDNEGDTLWTRSYQDDSNAIAFSVHQTSDGGYVISGVATYGLRVVKTDAQGDTMWTHYYGGEWYEGEGGLGAGAIQQTTDSGYVVVGAIIRSGSNSEDFYLVKTSAQGDTLWTRTYGGSHGEQAFSIQQTVDGGYVIAGTTYYYASRDYCDIYVVKTDDQGNMLWDQTYGGDNIDRAMCIQQTRDGGYVIAGSTRPYNSANNDCYVIKTNSQGTMQWTRTYGGNASDIATSIQEISSGGFVFAGYTMSFGVGWNDYYLVRINEVGDTIWTRTYGRGSTDWATSMQPTTDGGYIIAGWSFDRDASNSDFWLVRTEPDMSNAGQNSRYQPSGFTLSNFPNPFNSSTEIAFDLPKAGKISLKVFDLLGREVAVVEDGMMAAGSHRVSFDGKNLASGVYVYRLQTADGARAGKMVVLR